MERSRAVGAFVDSVWPKVRPEEVVAAVLTDPSDPLLTPKERRAVRWAKPPRSWKSARWSAADLVLIDEVAGLVERPGSYGHVVVDEAQDLSPMQCRAIARRVGFGSVTVLGDLAQGTTPWAARTWPGLLAHLGRPTAAVVPLTTGFRVPAAIVELANRLLGALDVDVPPGRSLRADGELSVRQVPDVVAATVDAVRAARAREGSVGDIATRGGWRSSGKRWRRRGWGRRPGCPCCPPRSPRAWSTTTSSPSSRPRSPEPRSGVCTGSMWC